MLELEAEVQADPTNHEAWFALGLKQQENEREDQAILALSKVVQLEPNHRAACLALAVSYTNESEREAANTMLEKWIELGEQVHGNLDGGRGDVLDSSMESRRDRLVERLIDIARETPDVVDADVQIALGVLFNSSEVGDQFHFSALVQRRWITLLGLQESRRLFPRCIVGPTRRLVIV